MSYYEYIEQIIRRLWKDYRDDVRASIIAVAWPIFIGFVVIGGSVLFDATFQTKLWFGVMGIVAGFLNLLGKSAHKQNLEQVAKIAELTFADDKEIFDSVVAIHQERLNYLGALQKKWEKTGSRSAFDLETSLSMTENNGQHSKEAMKFIQTNQGQAGFVFDPIETYQLRRIGGLTRRSIVGTSYETLLLEMQEQQTSQNQ